MDIHRRTAAAVLGIPEAEVTEWQRIEAKTINFYQAFGVCTKARRERLNATKCQNGHNQLAPSYDYEAGEVTYYVGNAQQVQGNYPIN